MGEGWRGGDIGAGLPKRGWADRVWFVRPPEAVNILPQPVALQGISRFLKTERGMAVGWQRGWEDGKGGQ
jgi:hypothetical protein